MKQYFIPFTSIKAIHFIVLLGFLVYGNVLVNGFVWDDKTYVVNNAAIHSINLLDAFKTNMFNQVGQYRPLPVIYFSTLYSLFNTMPFFYHLIQILLHICNTILLYFVFKHFFTKPLSFFLSLIFLIHPLQVESVAYIGASGNNLFFLFGISALLLTINTNRFSLTTLTILGCLLLFSLFSKETGGLFLCMLLTYTYIFKRKQLFSLSVLSGCVLLLYFSVRFFVGNVYFEKLDLVPIARLDIFERLLHIPIVVFYYLKNFLYPSELAIGQVWVIKDLTIQNFYLPLCIELFILLTIISFAWYLFKQNKQRSSVFIFFSIWFLLGVFFHSQIFPLDWTVADRWFYFTIVGLSGIIGTLVQSLRGNNNTIRIILCSLAVCMLVALSIRTMVRNTHWNNALALYEHDTAIVASWDIENNLGYEYKYIDNQPAALKHYLRSVELFPFESNLLNTGIVYGNMGEHKKAVTYYYKAMEADHLPSNGHKHNENTYYTLINGLLILDNPTEAKKVAEEAVRDYPESSTLLAQLAIAHYKLKEYNNAEHFITKAEQINSIDLTRYIYKKIHTREEIKIIPGKNEVQYL